MPTARILVTLALVLSPLGISCGGGSGGGDGQDPATIPAKELVQSGCSVDEDCPGGACIAGIGEGLCTADCTRHDHCPEGTLCIDTENAGGDHGVCLLTCTGSAECTEHLGPEYNCDTESDFTTSEDVRVCIDSR